MVSGFEYLCYFNGFFMADDKATVSYNPEPFYQYSGFLVLFLFFFLASLFFGLVANMDAFLQSLRMSGYWDSTTALFERKTRHNLTEIVLHNFVLEEVADCQCVSVSSSLVIFVSGDTIHDVAALSIDNYLLKFLLLVIEHSWEVNRSCHRRSQC